ncbi:MULTISPECIES: hypothetical protein [Bacillales]|jgi:hypothetical protein|uniref:DUF4320 family protein n=1 Tax=Caldibacillus debilis TaxID=301148 RepID=A0A150M9Y3_9BACI|nr:MULTISPECIES: hypothetical protein [Bacillaceae]KYD21377.1 hypothetical protein B4135_1657 [Caldibacillus debilis]OUM93615.1 MAG: hypothetical protein BAA00_06180 [Parageobacillus thermoglucosidasius]
MSKVLGEWMTLIIVINIMFAPILSYLDSLHREAVEVVLSEGARKAAVEGRFTDEIIDDMVGKLVEKYNFDEDKIHVEATTTVTPRAEYIEATITAPRSFIFVLNIFNQGPREFKKSIRVMSEYIGS